MVVVKIPNFWPLKVYFFSSSTFVLLSAVNDVEASHGLSVIDEVLIISAEQVNVAKKQTH